MPLTPTTYEVTDTFEEVSFLMLDGEQPVRVEVPRRVLISIARAGRGSPIGYMAAFEAHRRDLERLASAKYDAGEALSYANGCVVPVRADDLVQLGVG